MQTHLEQAHSETLNSNIKGYSKERHNQLIVGQAFQMGGNNKVDLTNGNLQDSNRNHKDYPISTNKSIQQINTLNGVNNIQLVIINTNNIIAVETINNNNNNITYQQPITNNSPQIVCAQTSSFSESHNSSYCQSPLSSAFKLALVLDSQGQKSNHSNSPHLVDIMPINSNIHQTRLGSSSSSSSNSTFRIIHTYRVNDHPQQQQWQSMFHQNSHSITPNDTNININRRTKSSCSSNHGEPSSSSADESMALSAMEGLNMFSPEDSLGYLEDLSVPKNRHSLPYPITQNVIYANQSHNNNNMEQQQNIGQSHLNHNNIHSNKYNHFDVPTHKMMEQQLVGEQSKMDSNYNKQLLNTNQMNRLSQTIIINHSLGAFVKLSKNSISIRKCESQQEQQQQQESDQSQQQQQQQSNGPQKRVMSSDGQVETVVSNNINSNRMNRSHTARSSHSFSLVPYHIGESDKMSMIDIAKSQVSRQSRLDLLHQREYTIRYHQHDACEGSITDRDQSVLTLNLDNQTRNNMSGKRRRRRRRQTFKGTIWKGNQTTTHPINCIEPSIIQENRKSTMGMSIIQSTSEPVRQSAILKQLESSQWNDLGQTGRESQLRQRQFSHRYRAHHKRGRSVQMTNQDGQYLNNCNNDWNSDIDDNNNHNITYNVRSVQNRVAKGRSIVKGPIDSGLNYAHQNQNQKQYVQINRIQSQSNYLCRQSHQSPIQGNNTKRSHCNNKLITTDQTESKKLQYPNSNQVNMKKKDKYYTVEYIQSNSQANINNQWLQISRKAEGINISDTNSKQNESKSNNNTYQSDNSNINKRTTNLNHQQREIQKGQIQLKQQDDQSQSQQQQQQLLLSANQKDQKEKTNFKDIKANINKKCNQSPIKNNNNNRNIPSLPSTSMISSQVSKNIIRTIGSRLQTIIRRQFSQDKYINRLVQDMNRPFMMNFKQFYQIWHAKGKLIKDGYGQEKKVRDQGCNKIVYGINSNVQGNSNIQTNNNTHRNIGKIVPITTPTPITVPFNAANNSLYKLRYISYNYLLNNCIYDIARSGQRPQLKRACIGKLAQLIINVCGREQVKGWRGIIDDIGDKRV